MGYDDCMSGFGDKLDDIVDICEQCEVCGGFLYDEFGRRLKREHMECRRILAMERGCEY
jgi:hypothetical protein